MLVLLNLLNELGKKIRYEAFLSAFHNEFNKLIRTNTRFYLSYDTKIAFLLAFLHQNVKISPLENATFLWTSTHILMHLRM